MAEERQTIINPPPSQPSSDGGAGWAVAIVILLIVVLFLIFGLPRLRNIGGGGTNINVPDRIDINTNGNPVAT